MSILLAIIALGLLILVHELGHFLAAKLCGVHVERFSIGFGPKLATYKKGETEYCLSAVPLGGYVKLHRMFEEEEAVEGKESQAFFNKSYPKKVFIIGAGALFNFIFAFILMVCVLMLGYKAHSPVVGDIREGSAGYAAQFQENDRIKAVNGTSVRSWEEFFGIINEAAEGDFANVDIYRETLEKTVRLEIIKVEYTDVLNRSVQVADTGMNPFMYPVIGGITPSFPAEQAGMRVGDRFVSVNGEAVHRWQDVSRLVRGHADESLHIVMQRGGNTYEVNVTPVANSVGEEVVGVLGVMAEGGDLTLRENPVKAVILGTERTFQMIGLIYSSFWQLVTGNVSRDNLGGPILIVQETANSAKRGIEGYLVFIAFISINLAILNLLPVPVLDGGHIVTFSYEAVTRRKMSIKARETGQQIGFALLVMLMVFAFYNDIVRFFR